MTETFYNDVYYYSPLNYLEYNFNRQQQQKYMTQIPYILKKYTPEKDLQIFYNTTTINNHTIPQGSTYKYTIPRSIDDIDTPSYNSISERQKRFGRESFGNMNNMGKSKVNINLYIFLILIFIFISLCI